MEALNTVGRRKASVARVHVTKGNGNITINGKSLKEYFTITHIQNKVNEPILMVENANEFDFNINVKGGGFKGQAEAIRMGIARAFVKIDEDNRKPLKAKKFLTRDARVVERKKFGKPKARKSFQFSKR
jgi:small subunit ribosomal protein S9